ncbi:unnamed protein product [Blepharisma stoltei]|uniref:Uncharacterized protein n=1 Tax=Blepharisma stoltei TaxID=1481888 RepID=A0AAU9KBU0_9CILI|nr:unnamed protein product [Blepharisma stoltei]
MQINDKTHLVPQKNQDLFTRNGHSLKLSLNRCIFAILAYFNWTHGFSSTDGDHAYIKQKFLEYSEILTI